MRMIRTAALALFVGLLGQTVDAQSSCQVTAMKYGNVCRCDETTCDSVTPLNLSNNSYIITYETEATKAHYLTRLIDQTWTKRPNLNASLIQINPNTTYQTITGFGGAFTDAAALDWSMMTTPIQSLLIDQYFSDNGIQYTLGRIPMAGCDFSTHSYSYDDVEGDYELTHFDVSMDEAFKFPFIHAALNRSSRNITLFASPWSAPYWMKTNNNAVGGSLKGQPVPGDQVHDSYAQYFVKFIDAYKQNGITIWGVTSQNEPLAPGTWDSDYFTMDQLRDFIKYNLGPALRKAHPEVKLICFDDQRSNLDGVQTILNDSVAHSYVDGIGVHWYGAVEDVFPTFYKLAETHKLYPEKFILPTEACEGFLPWSQGPYLGSWTRGMTYAYDILNDLLNWGVGWTDWNLMLDMKGGPNHANNVVDAPIILDTAATNVFYKQPMYYALGHFSKFIPAGSVRVEIDVISQGTAKPSVPLQSIAFLTPDNNIVLVLLNRDPSVPQLICIQDIERGYVTITTPPMAIQTVIYQNMQGKGKITLADM